MLILCNFYVYTEKNTLSILTNLGWFFSSLVQVTNFEISQTAKKIYMVDESENIYLILLSYTTYT